MIKQSTVSCESSEMVQNEKEYETEMASVYWPAI